MGISTSWNQVGNKFDQLATASGTSIPRRAVQQAAQIVKTSVLAELGGTRRLRNVGKNGSKIGVSYNIKGTTNPTALVRATGPFHLIEGDTKAHAIPRAGRPKRRGQKRRVVVINGQPYSRVNHPGTRGKHPWRDGVRRARPLTQAAFNRALHDGIVAIF